MPRRHSVYPRSINSPWIITRRNGKQEKAGARTKDGTGTRTRQKQKPEFRARASIFDHRRVDGASATTTTTTSDSLFRGFYALFWVVVALLVARLAAENWRRTGSPLGGNEFLRYIVSRDGALWFSSIFNFNFIFLKFYDTVPP